MKTAIVLILMKNGQRFIFEIEDSDTSAEAAVATMGKFAADPDPPFSWYDAGVLTKRIRELRQ